MITNWEELETFLLTMRLDEIVVSTWDGESLLGIDFKTDIPKWEEPESW